MIAAYWRGEITLRKLRVLVEGLPPQNALARARAGHHWTDMEYLLALLVDGVSASTVGIRRALGAKDPRPKPIPRPDSPRKPRAIGGTNGHSPDEVVSFLDSLSASQTSGG